MEIAKILFCIFCSVLFTAAIDLPPYFNKCKMSDPKLNDCILKNIVDNWDKFIEGDNKYHIQKLKPLHVPFMQIKVDNNFSGNVTDGKLLGYELTEFKSVNMDLDKKTMEIVSFWPHSSVVGKFDIKGKLLSLEISDTGNTNITFVRGTNKYTFNYQLKENKGKQHIEILDSTIETKDVERIYFHLEFSNNQQLGKSINEVLNENWKEVSDTVKDSVGETLGVVFKAALQPFFDKVPYDNFFAAE